MNRLTCSDWIVEGNTIRYTGPIKNVTQQSLRKLVLNRIPSMECQIVDCSSGKHKKSYRYKFDDQWFEAKPIGNQSYQFVKIGNMDTKSAPVPNKKVPSKVHTKKREIVCGKQLREKWDIVIQDTKPPRLPKCKSSYLLQTSELKLWLQLKRYKLVATEYRYEGVYPVVCYNVLSTINNYLTGRLFLPYRGEVCRFVARWW